MNNTSSAFGDHCLSPSAKDSFILTFKMSTLIILCLFGLIGNVIIIILAVKFTVRKKLHHLIISMAFGESLIVALILLRATVVSNIISCKIVSFFMGTSVSANYLTLFIISIERFRALRQTVRISRSSTLKERLIVVSLIWLVSAGNASLETAFYRNKNTEKNAFQSQLYVCQGIILHIPVYAKVLRYTLFISVIFVTAILSVMTLRFISRPTAIEENISESHRKARQKRRENTVKMVLSSLLLFSCCYLPFLIWNILKMISEDFHQSTKPGFNCTEFNIVDFIVTDILTVLNSLLSPFIYLFYLGDFREAAKKILTRTNRETALEQPHN